MRVLASLAAALTIAVASLFATGAQSAICPPGATDSRYLELNGAGNATCYAYGGGPMQAGAGGGNDNLLNGSATYPSGQLPAGDVVFLGKNVSSNANFGPLTFSASGGGDVFAATSGTWTLDTSSLSGYVNFIVGFQDGVSDTPAWAAFLLNGKTSGSWAIENPAQALSNYSLYGVVPLPAAAWLMITALGGLGLVARQRKARANLAAA